MGRVGTSGPQGNARDCSTCGKEFVPNPEDKQYRRRFCSVECTRAYYNARTQQAKKAALRRKMPEIPYVVEVKPSRVDLGTAKYVPGETAPNPKHVNPKLLVTDAPAHDKGATDGVDTPQAVIEYRPHPKQEIFGNAIEAGAKIVFMVSGIRTGKCLALDQRVLLADGGSKAAGDIAVGDRVLSYDPKTGLSRPCSVIGTERTVKPIIECLLSDDSTIKASADHRFPCWNIKRKRREEQSLLHIAERGDNYMYLVGPKKMQFEVRNLNDNFYGANEQVFNVSPYILGVILGDGCITQSGVIVSTSDEEILAELRAIPEHVVKKWGKYEYGIQPAIERRYAKKRVYRLKNALCKLGLWGTHSYTKFIPERYLRASANARLELLAGLIDTDGAVDRDQGSIEYTTCSKALADGVIFLLRSLGMRCRSRSRITKSQRGTPCLSYRIWFTPTRPVPLRVTRKRERLRIKTSFDPSRSYVKSYKVLGDGPCVDISIDHPSHMFLLENFIATHNTFAICAEALKLIYSYDRTPNLAFMVAPINDMLRTPRRIFEMLAGDALVSSKAAGASGPAHFIMRPSMSIPNNYYIIEQHSGEHANRMRGPTVSFVLCDEVAQMKGDVMDVIRGRVLESGGPILLAGTPAYPGHWTQTEILDRAYRCGKCHVCVYDHYDLKKGPDGEPEVDAYGKETRRYVPKDHDPVDCYGDPRIAVITCSTFDNTYLSKKEIEQLRADYALKDPIIARRELYGEYVGFEGLVYSHFDRMIHQSEYTPATLPEDAYVVAGIDFGVNDPFTCVFMARIGQTWHAVAEYFSQEKGKTLKDHVAGIKRVAGPLFNKVRSWWHDPSGRITAMELSRYGLRPMKSARKRAASGQRWVNYRIEVVTSHLMARDEKSRPLLRIAPSCANLIREFHSKKYKRYISKGDDGVARIVDLKGKEVERNAGDDVAPGNDHCLDALEYSLVSEFVKGLYKVQSKKDPDVIVEQSHKAMEPEVASIKKQLANSMGDVVKQLKGGKGGRKAGRVFPSWLD